MTDLRISILAGALRSSVLSTEASAGTRGAAMLAGCFRIASPSDTGWFGLAGKPLHSGCEARHWFRSRWTVGTLGP